MVPDCADLVMFLRQYFVWKLNLPIGRYRCSGRGIYNRDRGRRSGNGDGQR